MEMGRETERLERGEGWRRSEGRKRVRGGRGCVEGEAVAVAAAGVEEDEMRPNFLWQSPCSCCRCWGHFTKAGPDANVISS